MQKLNEKKILGTVPKKLQLVETFWDCPEFSRNKQNQKGITLIALIITIIVMLILVGVTINVALNGGLFQKAEYASEQMQIKAEEEELLSAVMGAIGNDGKIKFGDIKLPEGWSKVTDRTYKSPKENIYEVDENGKITYKGKSTGGGNTPVAFSWESVGLENIDTNTEYIAAEGPELKFTADGKLKVIVEEQVLIEIDATKSENIDQTTKKLKSFPVTLEGIDAIGTISMNENKKDVDVTLVATIEGTPQTMTFTCIKQEYDYSNEEVLKMLGITNSTGTYTGTWTVLGRDTDGNPTKLVSTRMVANYTLGYEDPKAIAAISAINENSPTETEKLERSIWSYNNAVSTLNTVAQETTGISSAKSITLEEIYDILGEENLDKGTNYGKVYNYYFDSETSEVYLKYKTGIDESGNDIWSTPVSTGRSTQIFVNENGEKVVIDSQGEEITLTNGYTGTQLTEEQEAKLGNMANNNWWIASPTMLTVDYYKYTVYGVNVFEVGAAYNLGYYNLFNSAGEYSSHNRFGVYAVIEL